MHNGCLRQWRQAQAGAEAEPKRGVPLDGIAFEWLHELRHLMCILRGVKPPEEALCRPVLSKPAKTLVELRGACSRGHLQGLQDA